MTTLTLTSVLGKTYHVGRAPKGGIEYGGKSYRGGQFCPLAAVVPAVCGGAPEPEAAEEPGVLVESDSCLSNSGYHRSGGGRSGAARWWLRGEAGFVEVPSCRGDSLFSARLDLAPGTYTLGTGRGKDAIRQRVVVR